MRKIVNKLVPIMLAFAMMITPGTFVKAETSAQTDVIEIATSDPSSDADEAAALLEDSCKPVLIVKCLRER